MSRIALPDPDLLAEIARRFEDAQSGDPVMRQAEPSSLIRHVPGKRILLRGLFHGRAAVFRIFHDPADRAVAREWGEMTRIWPAMQSGDLRVAEPLHYVAAQGIIVVEDVPGTPLMAHLYAQDPAQRAGYAVAPAAWLRRYTAGSQYRGRAKADLWLARAETESARQPHARLQRRERKVVKQLRRILDAAGARDWRYAISHGDFHPNNLILNMPRLTGIDLGGSAVMPVYKDIARFLMHMGRRGLLPSGDARFGVDREGFDAFAQAFDLDPWERDTVLPFMLGIEALIRVEGPKMSRSRIGHAAEMYDRLIADLSDVGLSRITQDDP